MPARSSVDDKETELRGLKETGRQLRLNVQFISEALEKFSASFRSLAGEPLCRYPGIFLADASFTKANCAGADLESAQFTKSSFDDCSFSRAHLRHADLSGTTLEKCSLYGADLAFCDLTGIALTSVEMDHCKMLATVWSDRTALKSTAWWTADFFNDNQRDKAVIKPVVIITRGNVVKILQRWWSDRNQFFVPDDARTVNLKALEAIFSTELLLINQAAQLREEYILSLRRADRATTGEARQDQIQTLKEDYKELNHAYRLVRENAGKLEGIQLDLLRILDRESWTHQAHSSVRSFLTPIRALVEEVVAPLPKPMEVERSQAQM